ncbi:testis-expressed protein 52 [Protopterus annectens]|uniref:testis-expressed protein 52 n=1 Tax=Protopterus annectens TaxID=7888 RepID=UPI001CFA6687|nr:testis-expressed protein 52 [Protopterus annectens]
MDLEHSVKEDEYLLQNKEVRLTGFSPKPAQRVAMKRPLPTSKKIHFSQKLLLPLKGKYFYTPSSYQTWLELGKLAPTFPQIPERPYDSKIWRNFVLGYQNASGIQSATKVVDSGHTIGIPPPSRMGANNYIKFVSEGGLVHDKTQKQTVFAKVLKEMTQSRKLWINNEHKILPEGFQRNNSSPWALKHQK